MFERVYAAVREIPRGRVATYGQIARRIGSPRAARAVGYALGSVPSDVPCHRVVNRQGGLSAAFSPCGRETHRLLLEMEGVGLRKDDTELLEQVNAALATLDDETRTEIFNAACERQPK